MCPDCHRTYSPMDVPMNFGPTGSFLCDSCGGELIDNEHSEGTREGEDKMAMFNSQTTWIQEGLRKTSDMIFPACVLLIHRPPSRAVTLTAVRQVRHSRLACREREERRGVRRRRRDGRQGRASVG